MAPLRSAPPPVDVGALFSGRPPGQWCLASTSLVPLFEPRKSAPATRRTNGGRAVGEGAGGHAIRALGAPNSVRRQPACRLNVHQVTSWVVRSAYLTSRGPEYREASVVTTQAGVREAKMASRLELNGVRQTIDSVAVAHGLAPDELWGAIRPYAPTEERPIRGSVLNFVCSEGTAELRLPAPAQSQRFEGAALLDWQRRFLGQTFCMTGVIELSGAMKVGDLPVVVVAKPGISLVDHVAEHGVFSGAELGALARQLGATIEELHRRGLHHLDIHPGNLVRGRRGWVLDHPRPVPVDEAPWGSEHDLPAFRDVCGCALILAYAATGKSVVDTEAMSDEVRHLIEAMPLGSDLAGFRDMLLMRRGRRA